MNGFSNLFLREPSFIKKANGMIVGVGEILEHERGINLTESRMNHIVFSSKPGKLFYDESGVCDELYFEDSIGIKHQVRNRNDALGKYVQAAQLRYE